MAKIFDRQFTGKYQPKRLDEDVWFKRFQTTLLWLANTYYGRELLSIDQNFPWINEIAKNYVKSFLPDGRILIDVRIGAKWANVIRYRWDEFCNIVRFEPLIGSMLLNPVGSVRERYLTSTTYPDPNVGTTSCDGDVGMDDDVARSWANTRSATGVYAGPATANGNMCYWVATSTSNNWGRMGRGIFLFDTSAVAGGTVSAGTATLSLFGTFKDSVSGCDVNIYTSTPASNTTLVSGDYAQLGTTAQATAITNASWSTSAYNDFTLNATGEGNIATSGITKFGTRTTADGSNSAPTWNSGENARMNGYYADQTGTTNDPKLVFTYTAAAATHRSPSGGVGNSSSFIIV